MKKCPQCAQVYGDDLNFCLNDGATLVGDVFTTQSETPTVVAGGFSVPTSTSTANTPPPTQIYQVPLPVSEVTPTRSKAWIFLAVLAVIILFGGIGLAGFLYVSLNGGLTAQTATNTTPVPTATPAPTKSPESTPDELQKEREKLAKEKEKLEKEKKALEQQKHDELLEEALNDGPQTATIIDPPTNIRVEPNGAVICVIRSKQQIEILGSTEVADKNGVWFFTDACGREGVVHSTQIRFNQ
jgi:hypothetical protein